MLLSLLSIKSYKHFNFEPFYNVAFLHLCSIIESNFINIGHNYLKLSQNVANRYLLIVSKFRNDSFIFCGVI